MGIEEPIYNNKTFKNKKTKVKITSKYPPTLPTHPKTGNPKNPKSQEIPFQNPKSHLTGK
jgi:hypothetical protein